MVDVEIKRLIPHRDRMMLIDEIVEVGGEVTVTKSRVSDTWPLYREDCVDPFVLLELIAQTAGIGRRWRELEEDPEAPGRKGWLVGIKTARFLAQTVGEGTVIETRSRVSFELENYLEITGAVKVDKRPLLEATLQVFWPDPENEEGAGESEKRAKDT
jgi:predicted hotdog family 3-hydroxylacyl-ACP dehydratase